MNVNWFTALRRPFISVNGHLVGHIPYIPAGSPFNCNKCQVSQTQKKRCILLNECSTNDVCVRQLSLSKSVHDSCLMKAVNGQSVVSITF